MQDSSSSADPAMAKQAHSAPLGITFLDAREDVKPAPGATSTCSGGFPAHMHGDAFVAFHGSCVLYDAYEASLCPFK